jgi:hypothetical protein
LWGAAFAAVVLGEHFGFDSAVGALLILSGCVYSSLGAKGIRQFLSNRKQELKAPSYFTKKNGPAPSSQGAPDKSRKMVRNGGTTNVCIALTHVGMNCLFLFAFSLYKSRT